MIVFKKRVMSTSTLLGGVALGLMAAAPSFAGPPAGYTLTWSDEFNGAVGSQPNTGVWNYDTGIGPNNDGWGNWEQETYVTDTNHLSIVSDSACTDGKALQITATNDNNWQTYGFHSARINTKGKFTVNQGYIEMRAKLPYGQGIWPSWWFLGQNIDSVGWPNCGEMDVMEMFGNNAGTNMGSYHMGTMSNRIDWTANYTLPNGAWFNGGYHTFGLLWNSSGVTNYVDGVQYETHASSSPGYAFNQPFYMILNLAIGGVPPGNVNSSSTTFPQYLDVDYIREYQPGATIANGVHTLTPACASGERLDDSGGGTGNGNLVQIWQANGLAPQQWNFNNIGGTSFNMAVNLGPYCLDDMGGAQGTQVAVWSCNGGTNQKWTATPVSGGYTLQNGGGLCLDVSGSGSANGTKVQSWPCNGTNAQTWAVN
jgi:beta-glucanase (GH16 family)